MNSPLDFHKQVEAILYSLAMNDYITESRAKTAVDAKLADITALVQTLVPEKITYPNASEEYIVGINFCIDIMLANLRGKSEDTNSL